MTTLKFSLIFIFMAFNISTAYTQNTREQQERKKKIIKELHFWESMKKAQEKQYRELRKQNLSLRQHQYETKDLMMRMPASQMDWEKQLWHELKLKLSKYPYVLMSRNNDSIQVPLSSFGLFRENLETLSDSEIRKIKPFLMDYASTLTSSKFWKHIKSVEVKVHASPVYRQKYVNPKQHTKTHAQKAYLYNLQLSSKRAQEITNLFYRPEWQSSARMAQITAKLRAVGESFGRPLKQTRAPANFEDGNINCGVYHCLASRRLELRLITTKKASH